MEESIFDIDVACKTVTPMLASGADQQALEIRTAEIKSGLRFWWRAFQQDSGQSLAGKEADLFGSTEGVCPFQLRVYYQPNRANVWMPGDSVTWPNGLPYLLYTVYDAGQTKKIENGREVRQARPPGIKSADGKNPGRPVAKPGQEFRITIKFRSLAKEERIKQTKDILRALWLLENFGGIGGRTRRGAGCFEITTLKINGKPVEQMNEDEGQRAVLCDLPSFFYAVGQKPDEFVKSGLNKIKSAWVCKVMADTPMPDYTTYCLGLSEVRVVWDDTASMRAMDLMSKIGVSMQRLRKNQPADEARAMHQSMANAINEIETLPPYIPTITKASLGMPIIYNFHEDSSNPRSPMLKIPESDNPKKRPNATFTLRGGCLSKTEDKAKGSDRRSSPLLISCHEKGGTPYAVFCHLPAELLPKGEKLYLEANYRDKEIGAIYEVPGHDFAHQVMRKICSDFPDALNKCIEEATWPLRTTATSHPQSQVQSQAKPKEKVMTSESDPIEILKDKKLESEGYILARLLDSPDTGGKIRRCARLNLKEDGSLGEDPIWTVKGQDVRALWGIKKGALFAGKQNPQEPHRLNDLKKI